ncbi:hypothetical protein BH11PLA1_BH11PLA1_07690 [soil metagenome]
MSSLTEGINFDKPTAKGRARDDSAEALEKRSQRTKLILAVSCMVVAGLLLAWNFGFLNFGGADAAKVDPVKETQFKQDVQKAQVQQKKEEAAWQNLPPSQRPVKVGAN